MSRFNKIDILSICKHPIFSSSVKCYFLTAGISEHSLPFKESFLLAYGGGFKTWSQILLTLLPGEMGSISLPLYSALACRCFDEYSESDFMVLPSLGHKRPCTFCHIH